MNHVATTPSHQGTDRAHGTGTYEARIISLAGTAGGNIKFDSPKLGFFTTNPVSKPTVTGAKGGNVALTSLLTALADLGLITNSTT